MGFFVTQSLKPEPLTQEGVHRADTPRLRSEKVERSFAHVLESGRFRRVYLRGRLNILKRYLVGVLCANLSLLMRKLFGFGTPKQAAALFCTIWAFIHSMFRFPDVSDAHSGFLRLRFT
jgi:hypothetical protein